VEPEWCLSIYSNGRPRRGDLRIEDVREGWVKANDMRFGHCPLHTLMKKHLIYLIALHAIMGLCLNESFHRSPMYNQAKNQVKHTDHIDTSEFDCYDEFNGTLDWETLLKSTFTVHEYNINKVKGGIEGDDRIINIDKIKGIVKESSKYNLRGVPGGKVEKDCQSRLYPSIKTKDEALEFEGFYYIPFHLSYDLGETSLITVWKRKNDELIEYVSNIENVIPTKYSRVLPAKRFIYNSKEFIVVKIQGAEEGESWEELYLYELINNQIVKSKYLASFSTSINMSTLITSRVNIKKDSIFIYKELWERSKKDKKIIESRNIHSTIIETDSGM